MYNKLFTQIVDESELHPNFKRIMNDPFKTSILEEWCDDELVLRDGNGKFIKEFQKTFNSSFWELYCYNVFKGLGGTIDFTHEYPDFMVDFNGQIINFECVVANNSEYEPNETDIVARLYESKDIEEIIYSQTIRLSNAFDKKFKKFINKYNKKEWVKGRPFIIAMEPFDQPHFMLTGSESIRTLLYGWKIEHDSLCDIKVEKIVKNQNINLDVGLLRNQKYEDISGVLFSNTATMGKVDALGNDPNLTFGQIRYNLDYDRPQIRVDSRLIQNKYDVRCKLIREIFKQYENDFKKYTIHRPYIQFGVNYKENIYDGLMLLLNPYAKYPLTESIINLLHEKGVNIVKYDLEKAEDIWSVCDKSLIQRVVVNLKI